MLEEGIYRRIEQRGVERKFEPIFRFRFVTEHVAWSGTAPKSIQWLHFHFMLFKLRFSWCEEISDQANLYPDRNLRFE